MTKRGVTSVRRRASAIAVLVLALAALFQAPGEAEGLRLPAIFADHAVLQRNDMVPVWGWAEPGATVTVDIASQKKRVMAGDDGRWRVDLAPMPAGGPYKLRVKAGRDKIVLKDIVYGEVWLGSGQSNMQWTIKRTDNWEKELARADNENIRFAMVFREHSPVPLDDLRGLTPWSRCTGKALDECYKGEGFSAVSYYFAKYLQAELGVPVGIINTSWGGTLIEPWTPPVGFDQVPSLASFSSFIRLNTPGSPEQQAALRGAIAKVEDWVPKAKGALKDGSFPPPLPTVASSSAINHRQAATALYNAMVAPLVPYANRGFIWYQGESNRGNGMLYRDKMEALIKGWRAVWQDDDLACYFVQLAPFRYKDRPQALPEIWEAQTAVLDIPGTGMAVINDIGDLDDIHPTNKDDVGKRLALLALNKTYGMKQVKCEGPLFDRFEVEGNAMRIYFKHAESLSTRDGKAPSWFTLCGADGVFRPANAKVDGATVVLTADGVTKPVAVRFAWDHCAEPNLMNEAGFPASAFRAGEVPVEGAFRELVPDAADMKLLCALDPTSASTDANKNVVYEFDGRAALQGKPIERLGYFLYLVGSDLKPRWVYAEMDAFCQNLNFVGVPVSTKGAQFQQALKHLVVKSNVDGLPTGRIRKGAIESWACNYGPTTVRGVKGASDTLYDVDDVMSMAVNPGYGCLQVHDDASGITLLAYNNHRAGRGADVGIGNCTGKHPDWTFSESAKECVSGRFLVLVELAD